MAVKETLPKVKLYVSISQHHHYTSVVDQLDSMAVRSGRSISQMAKKTGPGEGQTWGPP